MAVTYIPKKVTPIVAATNVATNAPTGAVDGFILPNDVGVVRTFFDYNGSVTALNVRLYLREPQGTAWYRSFSTDDLSPLTPASGDESRDWPVGSGNEFFFVVESISPGSGANTVAIKGVAVEETGGLGVGGGTGEIGGAITVADGDDESLGAIADASATAGSTGTISAKLRLVTDLLDQINTGLVGVGGGVQYTEGDVDASIDGTALMWEDAADTLRVISAAKPLPTEIVSGMVSVDDTDPIDVRGNTRVLRPTVPVSASPDYSVGDCIGGEITITNAVRTVSGGAVLQSIGLWCDDALTPILDIMFFDADLTGGTYTDNLTLVLSAADKAARLAIEHIVATDWLTIAGDTWVSKVIGKVLQANGTQDLRMIIVAGETINFTGTGVLTVSLGLLRD